METRKSVYYLSEIRNRAAAEAEISAVSGVLSASIDEQNGTLTYVIDEHTGEYEVFSAVAGICEKYGCAFDFARGDEGEKTVGQEKEKPADLKNDLEKSAEIPGKKSKKIKRQAENNEDVGQETEDEGDKPRYEFISADADYEGELGDYSSDDDSDGKKKKKKSGWSETVQRFIELGIALALFVLGLLLKDRIQLGLMACAFALAGYEVMYEAVLKIVKKQFVSEQLFMSVVFLCAVFLGYVTYAVAAMLVYSLVFCVFKAAEEYAEKHSPVYFAPESCRKLVDDKRYLTVTPSEVKEGDTVWFKANEFCLFDSIARNACAAENFYGEQREVEKGETVFAGERVLKNAFVVVNKTFGSGENDARNFKAAGAASEKSKLCSFINGKKTWIISALFIVCAIVAFIPPIFCKDYVDGMYEWAYRAIMLASLGSFTVLIGSQDFTVFCGLAAAKSQGVIPANYSAAEKIAACKQICLDESVLLGDDGTPTEDCGGAIMELRDCSVSAALIGSKSEDDCVQLCKQLKIPEFYAGKTTEAEKAEVMNGVLSDGGVCACSCETAKKLNESAKHGAVIAFKGDCDEYVGNAVIEQNEIALLPFTVKLAKRTVKKCRTLAALVLSSKAVLAVLALLGIGGMWWIALADGAVGLIAALVSYLNSKEVY